MTIPTDNRGTVIREGQKVAYNISGQVALGWVERVAPSTRNGWRGHTIHVRLLHDAAGKSEGHISKITNEVNLLVLKPGDSPELDTRSAVARRENRGW